MSPMKQGMVDGRAPQRQFELPPVYEQQESASVGSNGKMSNVQKRALYWMIAAVIYFIVPVDLDFAFPIGYLDDILFMWWAHKNYKQSKQGGEGMGVQFGRSMEEPIEAEIVDEAEWMPRRLYRRPVSVENPGFFARLLKGLMYILTGGAL